jgi:hypothetical protein
MSARAAVAPEIRVKKLFGKDLMAGEATAEPAVGRALESGAAREQPDRGAMRIYRAVTPSGRAANPTDGPATPAVASSAPARAKCARSDRSATLSAASATRSAVPAKSVSGLERTVLFSGQCRSAGASLQLYSVPGPQSGWPEN